MDNAVTVEEIVRRSWCEVLNLTEATPGANFFLVGGHSFAAVELMTKVEAALPVAFPFVEFLSLGTLECLVEDCVRQMAAVEAGSAEA